MNFPRMLSLLNQAIYALEQAKQAQLLLKDEIAAKNKLILTLQEQLATATTALFADSYQVQELQASLDKLEELSNKK